MCQRRRHTNLFVALEQGVVETACLVSTSRWGVVLDAFVPAGRAPNRALIDLVSQERSRRPRRDSWQAGWSTCHRRHATARCNLPIELGNPRAKRDHVGVVGFAQGQFIPVIGVERRPGSAQGRGAVICLRRRSGEPGLAVRALGHHSPCRRFGKRGVECDQRAAL